MLKIKLWIECTKIYSGLILDLKMYIKLETKLFQNALLMTERQKTFETKTCVTEVYLDPNSTHLRSFGP